MADTALDRIFKLQEEWFRENRCRDCHHRQPACTEGDQMENCFLYMTQADKREMWAWVNEELQAELDRKGVFRTKRDHDEYWADIEHASGEDRRG